MIVFSYSVSVCVHIFMPYAYNYSKNALDCEQIMPLSYMHGHVWGMCMDISKCITRNLIKSKLLLFSAVVQVRQLEIGITKRAINGAAGEMRNAPALCHIAGTSKWHWAFAYMLCRLEAWKTCERHGNELWHCAL